MNDFDKLFNQYFGENDKTNGFKMMMDLIKKLNNNNFTNLNSEDEMLGEPTNTREFERDGVLFEESTWETPHGTIVRITTKEDIEFTEDFFKRNNIPFGKTYDNKKEISLEDRLKNAVLEENYEEAAKIRDLIEKKENKEKASENLDNKGFPEKDEWNF
jgi:protein-arginine kinase activator protein McsA